MKRAYNDKEVLLKLAKAIYKSESTLDLWDQEQDHAHFHYLDRAQGILRLIEAAGYELVEATEDLVKHPALFKTSKEEQVGDEPAKPNDRNPRISAKSKKQKADSTSKEP